VDINILTYTFDSTDITSSTSVYVEQFNKYATRNNLNITINFDVMFIGSPTDSYLNLKSLVGLSLKKSNEKNNNNKFDMYFFDMRYTSIYGPYLLDLKENLGREYIKMYDSKIINETCTYKDKVVALVIFTY